jgi:large subunit ribosomal protein L5
MPEIDETEEQVAAKPPAQKRPRRSPQIRKSPATSKVKSAPVEQGAPVPRMQVLYRNEIVPTMIQEFGFSGPMEVPRIQKMVLNIGVGEAVTNSRALERATGDLATISGQKPIITRARKAIAAFKIREGNPIGTCVTLRGKMMYHFFDRLVNAALPRIRDFRGLPRGGFDGRGNFAIGIREQLIFPEIDYDKIDSIRGLQVTITTSTENDTEALRMLELFGMPFVRQN